MRLLADTLPELADVETALARVPEDAPPALARVVQAALAAPGKRVRPTVAILSYRACGGASHERAVELAAAVELVHTATLLVDDVVDDSPTRRGRPAPWTRFGTQKALLASGWLVARAGRVGAPSAGDVTERDGVVDDYVGVVTALEDVCAAEARALDATPLSPGDWTDVARGKTAALFAAAAEGGARKARRGDLAPAMRAYGTHLGLAFQARDDVLDWTGDPRALGKPAQGDAEAGRPNVVAAFGGDVAEATALAERYACEARANLKDVPASPARDALTRLARDAVTRSR